MPPKSKKKDDVVKKLVAASILAAIAGIAYVGFLWWQSRQVQFVHYKEFGIPIPADYDIHGIDVSRYQQTISWEAVKKMQVNNVRIGFAFIKATEGARNWDPFFKQNWKRAKNAGVVVRLHMKNMAVVITHR